MEAAAASGEAHPVAGGQKITFHAPSDKVFAAIVKVLNLSDRTVDATNKDSGLIATAIDIKGGYKQTGTRIVITVISISDSETLVRIASTEQKRYNGLQTEPWSDPKVDDTATAAVVAELQPKISDELAMK